ncbi:two-component regulator propeller domain-containing protein [Bacteroidota bacterium]
MKKVISLLIFFIIIWSNSLSQHSNWINYTFSSGVWDFEETLNSYWLATSGGLIRINKSDNSVEVLNEANSILSNFGGSLCIDSSGNLWIGSQANTSQTIGIIKYDEQDWEAVDFEGEHLSNYINALTTDKYDDLWFEMDRGIAKFDGDEVVYREIVPPDMSYGLQLNKIFFDTDNNVWFKDVDNIVWVLKSSNLDSLKGIIRTPCFKQDTAGNFWILNDNKLKCFSGEYNIDKLMDANYINWNDLTDSIIFIDTIVPQYGDTIRKFYIDRQNIFYVDLQSKLGILRNGNWQYLTPDNSQLPGSIHNLFVDSTGNLWATMWIPDKRFRIYKYSTTIWEDVTRELSNSDLYSNYISNFAKDSKNEMWIVSYNAEYKLVNFNGTTWTDFDKTNTSALDTCLTIKYQSDSLKIWNDSLVIITYNNFENEWMVFDNTKTQSDQMKIDQLGNIWWGTKNGLLKYNGNEWETHLEGNYFHQLAIDPYNVLYTSTAPDFDEQGVVLTYNDNIWDTLITCSGNAKWVASMVFDMENNLWFGVLSRWTVGHEFGDGLYKYNGQEIINYNIYNSDLPGNSVVYVTTDIDHNIWVGTYGNGLSIFKENQWTNYNVSNSPISSHSVEQIISDENGNIWASCQFTGITVIPYSEFSGVGNEDLTINNPNKNILIYPNPTHGNFNIKFAKTLLTPATINIFNLSGKKVGSQQIDFNNTENTYNVSLSDFGIYTNGIYFLQVSTKDKVYHDRLMFVK